MNPRQFIPLAASFILCTLSCSAATLIIDGYGDGYGDQVTSRDASASRSSFELIGFDLGPNLHTPFFRSSGIEPADAEQKSTAPWLATGFITLDSTDFPIDSPMANAEIVTSPPAGVPATPIECANCAAAASDHPSANLDRDSVPTRERVAYTLVITSFPRDAEGVYTNAIFFNRKEAHQPYAILMLREGLAAVEPLEVH